MTDPREPVYRKKGNRYVPFASLEDGWSKFDPWHSPGLWLHTRSDYAASQTLMATIDELPASAVHFASIMQHQAELTTLLADWRKEPISAYELSKNILNWIASKTTPTP